MSNSLQLPISVMIVGYNEAHLLKKCLDSVSFCNEIFYTDLGSDDDSINIASYYTTNILHRKRALVPSCEMVQTEVVHLLKNDWVIFIDPDEIVDPTLAADVKNLFLTIETQPSIGAVMVPWQFYFKNQKLQGTVWGGINAKYFLIHRKRFVFGPVIHYGRRLSAGFTATSIPYSGIQNVLHHYWMNSYKGFIQKHQRYLKNEAIDQYNLGVRVAKREALITPFKSFAESFITKNGYRDGLTGFLLSCFWAYYKTVIAVRMLRIQTHNTVN